MGVQIHLKEVINTYKNTLSIHFRNKHLNVLLNVSEQQNMSCLKQSGADFIQKRPTCYECY